MERKWVKSSNKIRVWVRKESERKWEKGWVGKPRAEEKNSCARSSWVTRGTGRKHDANTKENKEDPSKASFARKSSHHRPSGSPAKRHLLFAQGHKVYRAYAWEGTRSPKEGARMQGSYTASHEGFESCDSTSAMGLVVEWVSA